MTKCEKCGKESYVIYVGDWGHICPECEDMKREIEFIENSGWDHDDLDCPEYGEIIICEDLRRKENGEKEKMELHRGKNVNR